MISTVRSPGTFSAKSSAKENPPRYAKAFDAPSDAPGADYTDADNAKLIDSLKGLGYIE